MNTGLQINPYHIINAFIDSEYAAISREALHIRLFMLSGHSASIPTVVMTFL